MIRKANIDDATEIQTLMIKDLGYKTDIDTVISKLKSIDDKREKIFVCEISEKVVGVVHIEVYHSLYYKKIANIVCLAVNENFRRRGIGKALIAECEKWALSNDLSAIRLESSMHRKNAHDFYRAVGFDNEKKQIRFLMQL